MRASDLIQEVITQDFPVGLDLELIVRRDAYHYFKDWIVTLGWESSDDPSVMPTEKSLERLYNPIEIKITRPTDPQSLLSSLSKILAWLKAKDEVLITSSGNDILSPFSHGTTRETLPSGQRVMSGPRAAEKFIKFPRKVLRSAGFDRGLTLPRGRSPMNLSAGCHLHFDLNTWFDSADHVERFIRLFYNSSDKIKGQVIKGRYVGGSEGGSGDVHAPFYRLFPDRAYPSNIRSLRGQELLGRQSQALSVSKAHWRGDIEVRVFHSSLNIQTITHWFNLVIEMIEYTRTSNAQQSWEKFTTSTADTDLKRQLASRETHLRRHPFPGKPYGRKNDRPTRAVSRILRVADWGPPSEE